MRSCHTWKFLAWEYRERSDTILSKSQGKGAPAAASQALLCSFQAICKHNFAVTAQLLIIFFSSNLIVLWNEVAQEFISPMTLELSLGSSFGAPRVPSLEMKELQHW